METFRTVTEVVSALKFMLYELIQTVQIDIGTELAVQVSDGKALVPWRMEQGLMGRDFLQTHGIAPKEIILRTVVKDQNSGKPEGILILDLAGYHGEEDIFVYGHEVVPDVELNIVGRGEKPEGLLPMDVELLR